MRSFRIHPCPTIRFTTTLEGTLELRWASGRWSILFTHVLSELITHSLLIRTAERSAREVSADLLAICTCDGVQLPLWLYCPDAGDEGDPTFTGAKASTRLMLGETVIHEQADFANEQLGRLRALHGTTINSDHHEVMGALAS